MLISYLKIALRNLLRHKGYSAINIIGLTTGLVCCLLILLLILHELSYDRFHQHADRIYRVLTDETGEQGTEHLASTNTPLAPLLAAEFPEMEKIVRVVPYSVSVKSDGDRLFQEDKFVFADSTFFEIFTFQFLNGDSRTALREPYSVILTESAAKRYFGSTDVVGKTLTVEAKHLFTVTGVLPDVPATSSVQFSLLANIQSADKVVGPWLFQHWFHPPMYTFVLLDPAADSGQLNARFPAFMQKRLGERFSFRAHRLQPLTSMHLTPDLGNELVPTTSPAYIYTLAVIALFILLLACINFTNLSTARSLARAKEVGLRKVVGAERGELIRQFLGESIVYSFLALILAAISIELLMPLFNTLTGKQLVSSALNDPVVVASLLVLCLLVGAGAGAYPAFVLSGFQPVRIFRGEAGLAGSGKSGTRLRATLVILQFTISITLIVSTAVIHSQLSYIQSRNIGFNKEQLLVLPIRDYSVQEDFETIKHRVLAVSGVSSGTALSNFPWEKGFYGFPVKLEKQGQEYKTDVPTILIDHDFIRTFGMEIVAGRDLSKDLTTDTKQAFIINQTAAKRFGFDEPLGMKLTMSAVASGQPKQGEVVGVVKDFHIQSLHHEVQPLVLTVSPAPYYLDNMVVRLQAGRIRETIEGIEEVWRQTVPDRPFEFFFLDQTFDNLYRQEMRFGAILNTFSALAIAIGCLGLFGLASYTIQRRTKEVGIRKVMGASVPGVVGLLSKDFVKLVLIANVVAWPIAYVLMNRWLEDFAYRVTIHWWIFALAGGAALLIALLTVSVQAVRAALANPVEALRYE